MTADNEYYEVAPYDPSAAMVIPPAVAAGSDDYINYAGPPTLTPPIIPNVVLDSNGQVWLYANGAWNASTGGSGGAPDSIAYAGPPLVNPPSLQNIVVDSAGQQWMYWGNAWH